MTGSRQPGRRGSVLRRGFTLIEVVVVLLILAVAMAVAVPAFVQPAPEDAMTEATGRIEALFRFARDSAARSGLPVVVAIDSASGDAWVYPVREHDDVVSHTTSSRLPIRAPGTLQRQAALREAAGESLELPPSVRLELTRARAQFVFRPAGATYGDSLVLRHGSTVRVITIDPWTGHARTW